MWQLRSQQVKVNFLQAYLFSFRYPSQLCDTRYSELDYVIFLHVTISEFCSQSQLKPLIIAHVSTFKI
jgi:hypothetical protein